MKIVSYCFFHVLMSDIPRFGALFLDVDELLECALVLKRPAAVHFPNYVH